MWSKPSGRGFIFIISGPSGSGKTTLAKKITQHPQLKGKFIKSVSFTTRPRRAGEREGRDYFFVSKKQFQGLRKSKKILESTHYLGYDYGTPRDYLEQAINQGLHAILCLDIQGALFVKKAFRKRAVTIFVKPPSLEIARQRIFNRCAGTRPKEVARRMRLAGKELEYAKRYDYYLVNDNLTQAVKQAVKIIQEVLAR